MWKEHVLLIQNSRAEFPSVVLMCYSLDGIYWSHWFSSRGESWIPPSLHLWNQYFLDMPDAYELTVSTSLSMVPTATVGKKYLGKTCKFSQMSKMWRVIYAKKPRWRQQTESLFSLTHQMLRHGTVLLRLPLHGPSSFS